MDLSFTPEERAFREEMRTFFTTQIAKSTREHVQRGEHVPRDEWIAAHRTMNANGLAVPHWPREWGGRDWSPVQIYIWQDEMQLASCPPPLQFNCNMVGPVIAQFGSEAQKQRFLPATANLDIWWCQGFSEPGAGSDLASLRTSAVRDGDHYVVNGQKTWTTLAQYADWIFCLVRTDPAAKKQEGISFLLVDMKTPGHHRATDPDDRRGPRGQRGLVRRRARSRREPGRAGEQGLGLREIPARQRADRDRPRGRQQGPYPPHQAARRARARGRSAADRGAALPREGGRHRGGAEGAGDDAASGGRATNGSASVGKPNPASSVLKLKGSELQQATTALLMDVVGPYVLPYAEHGEGSNEPPIGPDYAAEAAPTYFNWRKISIYGGSNEIQRNIVAKAILGF